MSDCRRKPINEQREKLIELICTVNCEGGEDFLSCPERRNGHCRSIHKLEMCQLGAIADHLLANRVIVPPVKVGETVYVVNSLWVSEYTVEAVWWDGLMFQFKAENEEYADECSVFYFFDERIGKTVFLSREDAEKALKINTPTDTPTVNTIA